MLGFGAKPDSPYAIDASGLSQVELDPTIYVYTTMGEEDSRVFACKSAKCQPVPART
jgi:hypothetical protein